MENNYTYDNLLYKSFYVMHIIPIVWGIYEFRLFRIKLNDFLTKLDYFKSISEKVEHDINDISNNKLNTYPILLKIDLLINKVNKIINVQ